MRYFFHIGYNGSNYRGWQRLPQTRGEDVQSVIEASLARVLKIKNVSIVGCGRTDARVHASQFFFHIDIEKEWDFDLVFRLNKNLPPDIALFDIIPMEGTPHARFDAVERTYNYFIHTYKDPHCNNVSSYYQAKDLNIDEIRKAAGMLLNYDDYGVFSKNIDARRSLICKITRAEFHTDKNCENLRFEISANRFLNGMVRIIVHKLLTIGRGELSVDEFENYLVTGKKPGINRLAYPQGLFLTKVRYPFLDLPERRSGPYSPAILR